MKNLKIHTFFTSTWKLAQTTRTKQLCLYEKQKHTSNFTTKIHPLGENSFAKIAFFFTNQSLREPFFSVSFLSNIFNCFVDTAYSFSIINACGHIAVLPLLSTNIWLFCEYSTLSAQINGWSYLPIFPHFIKTSCYSTSCSQSCIPPFSCESRFFLFFPNCHRYKILKD